MKTSTSKFSRRKQIAFWSLLLGSPLLLLCLMELTFRALGLGGYPPFFRRVGPVAGGTLVVTDRNGARSWFSTDSAQAGSNEEYAFVDPKPTNTYRIFIAGESAAKGYPEPRNLASSAFLQAMLQDAWPERRIEVINLGTTAVASYPVLGIVTAALQFEPDLIFVHTGHNEFYGAYGVASTSRAGSKPWMLGATRLIRSLALVQACERIRKTDSPGAPQSLMESMVGQGYVAPDDWRRKAAADNLYQNLSRLIKRCQTRGVPVVVCTVPSNECDLAPIGSARQETLATNSAWLHFRRAETLESQGKPSEALHEFEQARDLDTMPWRATSLLQAAILRAATENHARVCDLVAAFRQASPRGAIGWELMDDHVHPTLRGQALMAETFLNSLTNLTAAERARIKPWELYAHQLGANPYDRYAVTVTLRALFNVPFIRSNNLAHFRELDALACQFEEAAEPEVRAALRTWRTSPPNSSVKRPLAGIVARVLARQGKWTEACDLFASAQQSVSAYSSLHLEYVNQGFECRARLGEPFTLVDRERAAMEIERGKVLLRIGHSESGFTEYYLGRLYQWRGEFATAIPFLNASRGKLTGLDLVAAEYALINCWFQTGATNQAADLVRNRVASGGPFAALYREMLAPVSSNSPGR